MMTIAEAALASLRRQQAQVTEQTKRDRQTAAAKATSRGEIVEFAPGGAWVQQFEGDGGRVFVTLESAQALNARDGNTPGSIVTITGTVGAA